MGDIPHPDISLFLASSVHDMKNSISVLIGSLQEMMSTASPETSKNYQKMAHMLYETQRINGNLIQLLTLYKFGNNLYPFTPDTVEIDEFAAEAQSHVGILLNSKHIVFEIDSAPGLYGEFDQELVAGVIVHALNNAAHYTKDRIRLVILEADGGLEFRVEDNGSGYPQRMIDEGVAAMSGINYSTGSTGLGLYFSAAVALMHRNGERRGSVRLENGGAWGGGCFVLRLP